jgi:penicillin-binding protein 2
MGTYPPGSTFKPAMGLIFLQEGVITPDTYYSCAYGYPLLGGKPKCHGHPSPLSLIPALATSCNSYFCWGLRDMIESRRRYASVQAGLDVWKDHLVTMGYGYRLGVDLPGEKAGYIPNSKTYDRLYNKRWASSTIISVAIGQGEVLATPLQVCNVAASIANRGYFYTPHIVQKIEKSSLDTLYTERRYPSVDPGYYEYIAEGMRNAVVSGTCYRVALPDIEVCGKTGTSQNPRGKDHSIFMGFAPYHNSKVAISVIVENAGFGATYAVPIAKLMLEKFFSGDVYPEDKPMEEFYTNISLLPRNAL